jgi:type VI secretion system protein ImpK
MSPQAAAALDDDPTIVWHPGLRSALPAAVAMPEEALQALPNPVAWAPVTLAAMPLLAAIIAFRRMPVMTDLPQLRNSMITAVKLFEKIATESETPTDDVVAARYLLCCALDEAIATRSAPGETDWSRNSLLVSFHGESWGGDKAFMLIDRLRQDPKRYRDLLQLAFFILALGFEGRYRVMNNGLMLLGELRSDLARQIGVPKPQGAAAFAFAHQPLVKTERRGVYVPLWLSLSLGAAALIGIMAYLDVTLDTVAAPTAQLMARVEHGAPLTGGAATSPAATP